MQFTANRGCSFVRLCAQGQTISKHHLAFVGWISNRRALKSARGPEGNGCLVYTCMIMLFTFAPNRARPPRGGWTTKVGDNGLVIQWVSAATTQPAEAAGVIFITEFSRLGLIAVFVLVFCVGARANISANINHANHDSPCGCCW